MKPSSAPLTAARPRRGRWPLKGPALLPGRAFADGPEPPHDYPTQSISPALEASKFWDAVHSPPALPASQTEATTLSG